MISDAEVLGRLALALALRALIGLEREGDRGSAVGRSWPAGVLDPLAEEPPEPAPLAAALADPGIEVIVHAGRQDVAILRRTWRTEVTNVFDTQVAAGFVGFGTQEGYKSLVRKVLGVSLPGGEAFTQWDRRPLTPEQLEYARGDAAHLLQLGRELQSLLAAAGRLEWAQEECRAVAAA